MLHTWPLLVLLDLIFCRTDYKAPAWWVDFWSMPVVVLIATGDQHDFLEESLSPPVARLA
jgi:hypothetical protein